MEPYPKKVLSLIGILVMAVSLACGISAVGSNVTSQTSANDEHANGNESTVTVVTQDFKITLDASQVRPGTITFSVRNEGHMPHDFAIQGNGVETKTPMIDPGETETLVVTLESGSYTYVCTVPGHAMLGMQGTFTVES